MSLCHCRMLGQDMERWLKYGNRSTMLLVENYIKEFKTCHWIRIAADECASLRWGFLELTTDISSQWRTLAEAASVRAIASVSLAVYGKTNLPTREELTVATAIFSGQVMGQIDQDVFLASRKLVRHDTCMASRREFNLDATFKARVEVSNFGYILTNSLLPICRIVEDIDSLERSERHLLAEC